MKKLFRESGKRRAAKRRGSENREWRKTGIEEKHSGHERSQHREKADDGSGRSGTKTDRQKGVVMNGCVFFFPDSSRGDSKKRVWKT